MPATELRASGASGASGASDMRPASSDRLPTLTEVLEHGYTAPGFELATVPAPEAAAPCDTADPASDLAAAVLADLLPRIAPQLEARLRDVLAPALARAADQLLRELRLELAATLGELVDDAVRRALARPGQGA